MIYLFTGQPGSGKTTLAKKLQMWLQTDKKNWRKSVFHIDGDQLRELFPKYHLLYKYIIIIKNICNNYFY